MIQNTSDAIAILPGLHFMKDTASRYLSGSFEFTSQGGLSHVSQLTHLTDFDMPWAALAEQYQSDDKRAMQQGCIQKFELFLTHQNEEHFVLTTKRAIIENGKVIGVIGSGQVVSPRLQQELLTLKIQHKTSKFHQYDLEKTYPSLTERESNILFHLIRAKSPKVIAAMFCISHRTVEKHIEKIKCKLHVKSKSELIAFAWENEMGSVLLKSQINL